MGCVTLIDKCLLVRRDSLAEHVVCPALIGEHDGYENQRDDRHDGQSILRGGCVEDRQ